MGKYQDDDEREADYQRWLYYREFSHEEREQQRKQTPTTKKQESNSQVPVRQPAEWPVVDVFRDYPEHQRMIAEAERKFFESRQSNHVSDEGDDSN
ncbi:hypothetical protein BVE25_001212 [Salmonella enterica subsp. enterica]|nr:hypothetical protein [Salmonella enterica subsp. enterica]